MMDINISLNVLEVEPLADYNARSKTLLTWEQLNDFMVCPWLYRKKQMGLIEDADNPAKLFDEAVCSRILEGRDVFEPSFPAGTFTSEDVDRIEMMAGGVAMNNEAVERLLYGLAGGVIRTTYCDTPCQARFDWIHPHRGIVQLKVVDDLRWFESDCRRGNVYREAAFLQSMMCCAIDRVVPVFIVAVEKKEPFRSGVWQVSDQTLGMARRENEAGLRGLRRAWEVDDFPTGYEHVRILDVF